MTCDTLIIEKVQEMRRRIRGFSGDARESRWVGGRQEHT